MKILFKPKFSILRSFLLCLLIYLYPFSVAFGHASVQYPSGGESFKTNNQITIKWSETVDHGGNNWDLYYSTNNGSTWIEIALDLTDETYEYDWTIPNVETEQALVKVVQDNNSGTNYEGTSGTFRISTTDPIPDPDPDPVPDPVPDPDPDPVVTDLEDDIDNPGNILLNNYPNPFHNSTTIKFYLPRENPANLIIYALDGRIVYRSKQQRYSAGKHEILWRNVGQPDGIYICKLMIGNSSVSRKLSIRTN